MNLNFFISKYSDLPTNYFSQSNSNFEIDFQCLKRIIAQDPNTINLAIEKFIENKFPIQYIKQLVTLNYENDLIINNNNLFKWACAFHDKELILYFKSILKNIDYDGAINASIINGRFENFLLLVKLEAPVFQEKYFSKSIQRFNQNPDVFLQFIDYYITNKDKFNITEFSLYLLNNNLDLLDQALHKNNDLNIYNNTIDYLLSSSYPILTIKKTLRILVLSNNLKLIKKFLNSEKVHNLLTQKDMDDFLVEFCNTEKNQFNHISLEIVKYILLDKNIPYNSNIFYLNSQAFINSCIQGNIPLVDFFINSNLLPINLNINIQKYAGFIKNIENQSYTHSGLSFSQYCIFDLKIKKSIPIVKYLNEFPNSNISNMFLTRDLNLNLNKNLNKKNIANKIKI